MTLTTHNTLNQQLTLELIEARKYLKRLCKHFQHKVPVQYDEKDALIEFEEGFCAMQADNKILNIHCQADNSEDLKAITDTLDRHLSALCRNQVLELSWHNVNASSLTNKWM